MITAALALLVLGAIVAPHVICLDSADPGLAATVWFAGLALRALATLGAVLSLVILTPTTQLFHALTRWYWHTVLPLVATDFGLDGHAVGHFALIVPALALAGSTMSVGWGICKAARAVARLVQGALGPGPSDTVVIGDQMIMVAAAGLRHPKVIVSAGALTAFDDAELYASLDHERGHIRHRHRWILIAADLCRALGRPLPGRNRALSQLAFHLERDADRYAVRRSNRPDALASAICKAAQSTLPTRAPALALAGSGAARRVSELLEERSQPVAPRGIRMLAIGMVGLVVALGASLPSATLAAASRGHTDAHTGHCAH